LADGTGRERLDVDFGTCDFVLLVMPARECGEEKNGEEGEDNGDDSSTFKN
jgi:hypothetical protein